MNRTMRLLAALLASAALAAVYAQDAAPGEPPKPTGPVIPPTMDLSRPAGSTDDSAADATSPPEADAAVDAGAAAPAEAPAAVVSVITPDVETPRPFGYVLGDKVVQRVALDHEGQRLTLQDMPPVERAGNWFDRQDVRVETDAAGRHWLRIEYQIINVPEELRAIELPALDLATTGANQRLQTTPVPLTVAPLTPEVVLARAGLDEIRPDLPAPHIDTAPYERGLHAALAAGAALVGLWLLLALMRQINARRNLPFSRAQRDIGRLPADSVERWRRLHRALDDTAGQVVRAHDLPVLIARAPWLAPLDTDLRRFFTASQARFFADRTDADIDPQALCAQAARLERRALA